LTDVNAGTVVARYADIMDTTKRLLVGYASTDGQTRKICRVIADWCIDAGHQVELLPVAEADDIDLSRFDAIVLAGSVHGGHYQKPLTEFCTRRAEVLASRPGLFLSVSLSAAGHDAEDWRGLERILEDFMAATGWTPSRVEQVAGAYLPSRYDVFRRFVMRRILAVKEPDADLSADIEYTDWTALKQVLSDWTGSLSVTGVS
jgi:menaquinone-dependent protoporphyrinogen oxidase